MAPKAPVVRVHAVATTAAAMIALALLVGGGFALSQWMRSSQLDAKLRDEQQQLAMLRDFDVGLKMARAPTLKTQCEAGELRVVIMESGCMGSAAVLIVAGSQGKASYFGGLRAGHFIDGVFHRHHEQALDVSKLQQLMSVSRTLLTKERVFRPECDVMPCGSAGNFICMDGVRRIGYGAGSASAIPSKENQLFLNILGSHSGLDPEAEPFMCM